MKEYVLDANALVRYFRGGEGAAKVETLLVQADKGVARLCISAVNLTEVLYVSARYLGMDTAQQAVRAIQNLVEFVPADEAQAHAVARIRTSYKLGIADSFAAELALRRNATLVTADPEFAKIGKQIKILALPRHAQ